MALASERNASWHLESFLDSLLVELDKAQDTLSVKGLSRPLTYTVKDVALDLQIFPQFDGRDVRFTTARPGDTGASKIAIQLGSITNEQIRRTTKEPISRDDLALEEVDGLDDEVKTSLRKYGVNSVKDLERWEKRNVDVGKLVNKKTERKQADYGDLANLINQARRKKSAPSVSKVSLTKDAGRTLLRIEGENLALAHSIGPFPMARLGLRQVHVVHASANELQLAVSEDELAGGNRELEVALDPYALLRMELKD